MTFYTGKNNIFYLELAIDHTEFIRLHDFDVNEIANPDELIAQTNAQQVAGPAATEPASASDHDELLKSLGM